MTSVTPGGDWATVTSTLATSCAALAAIDQVTVQTSGEVVVLLDDVRFEN